MTETTIGNRTRVQGTIRGEDRLVVQGHVAGTIELSAPLVVGRGGLVEAEVRATEVAILGSVTGHVVGIQKVEILPEARMVGDVGTARILISDGAVFKGRVDMDIGEV
jgi:cytoskeletal protein CcmA (bactofilin family)